MAERVLLVCPGRGSYTASELGSLEGLASSAAELAEALERFDEGRRAAGREGVLELDAAERWGSRLLRGDNAAPLTFAVTARDVLRLDPDRARVVAVTGNSMGWYSALWCAGALELDDALELIERMGILTAEVDDGGQIVYPLVDDDWRRDPDRADRVEAALASAREAGHLAGHSIRFGGFAVLCGDGAAIRHLQDVLPAVELGSQSYPLELFGNGPFHSSLMEGASERALGELAPLAWRPPARPLIDGRGHQFRPLVTDADELYDYTLGHQVVDTFDLAAAIRVGLREYAPDRIVLAGPGDSLGAAVAQVVISEGWQGIAGREEFLGRQERDPFLLSMARPEQAELVVRPGAGEP